MRDTIVPDYVAALERMRHTAQRDGRFCPLRFE